MSVPIIFDKLRRRTKKSVVSVDYTVFLFFFIIILVSLILFSFTDKFISVLFLCLVFLISVLFHDIIQILVVRLFSYKLKRFILFPFGSKKVFDRPFDKAVHELIYAFSGPLSNLILLLAAFVIAINIPGAWPQSILLKETLTAQTFDAALIQFPLFVVFWINFLLFVFNLLVPALPLDGGRIFHSLLTIFFGSYSSNKILPIFSKVLGFIVILCGFIFWDILVLVFGVFIYFMSNKEAKENELYVTLEGQKAGDYVSTKYLLAKAEDSIYDVFTKMSEQREVDVIVDFGKDEYGVISVDTIASIPKLHWASEKAGDHSKIVDHVLPSEGLAFVVQYMMENNLNILPVFSSKDKQISGVLKRIDIASVIRLGRIS